MEDLHKVDQKSEVDKVVLSIVVPAYNEEEVIEAFYDRITLSVKSLALSYEIIFVNDGSRDLTISKLLSLQAKDSHLKIIDLSRNFGQQIAITAGIDYAGGEAVVVIDPDLQDLPELIPRLVEKWKEGYDVVYATRSSREGETWFRKTAASLFYKIMRKMTNINIPSNTAEFRLMNRSAVEALKQFREQHRFMRGLFTWIGFRQVGIPYRRDPRYAGSTGWSYWKLWRNLALEGITSFSSFPLRIATYIGLIVLFLLFLYTGFVIFMKPVLGETLGNYSLILAVSLFLGGVQLMALGIIGEYIWRIYMESKRRPLYFVQRFVGFKKKTVTGPDTEIHSFIG